MLLFEQLRGYMTVVNTINIKAEETIFSIIEQNFRYSYVKNLLWAFFVLNKIGILGATSAQ